MGTHRVNLTDEEIAYLIKSLPPGKSFSGSLERKLRFSLKRITVKSAKAKGRGLQQWLCGEISRLTGLPYDQKDDQCLIHSREMGQGGKDVILRGEALKRFPYSPECKATETLKLMETIIQAKENQSPGTAWLIVHRKKGMQQPIVILDWEVFYELQRKTSMVP